MPKFNIAEANKKLTKQFIRDAGLTCYEEFVVVQVTDHGSSCSVEIRPLGDSTYTDTVTIETLDLVSYVAFKAGLINL